MKQERAVAGTGRRCRIDPQLLQRTLRPYFRNVRYLQCAWIVGDRPPRSGLDAPFLAEGDFEIEASCYIESTGHFNAVEFILCINQLGYAAFAYAADQALYGELLPKGNDLDWFHAHQLSNVLILEHSAKFIRVLNPNAFHARLGWNASISKPTMLISDWTLDFWDDAGGHAAGTARIGILK